MRKFYCPNCRRLLNRFQVEKAIDITEEPIYFCSWCEESVIKTEQVLQLMVADYVDYMEKNHEDNQKRT